MLFRNNEFQAILKQQGKTQNDCAKCLGISANTMSQRIKSGVFGSDEIFALTNFLNIENPAFIFFADNVTSKDTRKQG